MNESGSRMRELPNALTDGDAFAERLAGRRLAVFLDYDGTLTPIVDRPQDAVISASMREAVRALAARCAVCVVSGRDRPVVQELMGSTTSSWPEATALTSGAPTRARSSTRRALDSRSCSSGSRTVSARRRARSMGPSSSPRRLGRGPLPARRGCRATADRRARRRPARGASRRAQGHARQDGLRDPAEARLGQGQGRAASARRWGSTMRTWYRSTWATTSPTSTPSRLWRDGHRHLRR